MEQATPYHSQGLLRALGILKAVGASTVPLSLGDLSADLDLPKSTLVRLLTILEESGFLHRDPAGYSIGHAVLELGETYRKQANVAEVAAPYLRELASVTGLTTNIGILEGRWVLHVVVEEPDRPLRFRSASGSLDYTYSTGLGKMLMSGLPVNRLGDHLPAEEPWQQFTANTIVTVEGMLNELAAIRDRGYSIDQQERDLGVVCMAVPIPNEARINVALSVAGPTGELGETERERYLPILREMAIDLGENPRFIASLGAAHGRSPLEAQS